MLIPGASHTDRRGTIRYVNDFDFAGVKRFYAITHPDTGIVRAWQGHRFEYKYLFVTTGSFVIAWIGIDDWETPRHDLAVSTTILTADESGILVVTPGHANGFRALKPHSTMMVFSDRTLEETKVDDYRWDPGYFSGAGVLLG